MRRVLPVLLVLPLLVPAPAAADDVDHGRRIGPLTVGMTKGQMDRKLGERGQRAGTTVLYRRFQVVMAGTRSTVIRTFSPRYDLLGVTVGDSATSARRRLASQGFRGFDCRAGNGTFGLLKGDRTRIDFVRQGGRTVVQTITVGRGGLTPSCE